MKTIVIAATVALAVLLSTERVHAVSGFNDTFAGVPNGTTIPSALVPGWTAPEGIPDIQNEQLRLSNSNGSNRSLAQRNLPTLDTSASKYVFSYDILATGGTNNWAGLISTTNPNDPRVTMLYYASPHWQLYIWNGLNFVGGTDVGFGGTSGSASMELNTSTMSLKTTVTSGANSYTRTESIAATPLSDIVQIWFSGDQGTVSLYDNVKMLAVPEPSSLVITGVGSALAIAARRRRSLKS